MSAWKLLGLEPTNDLKAIKKAYAVLLKLNKPDENPEGFAQLHQAYKGCCAHAKRMGSSTVSQPQAQASSVNLDAESETHTEDVSSYADSSGIDTEPQVSYTIKASLPIDNAKKSNSPEPALVIDTPYIEEIVSSRSLDQAEADLRALTLVALDAMRAQDNPQVWDFIERCDELYDISFKQGYSQYLLEQVLRFFDGNSIAPKKRRSSLNYLDSQFDWLGQAREFEELWGYQAIAPVFDVLHLNEGVQERKLKWFVDKRHHGPIEDANYYARLSATGFDLIAFFMAANFLLPSLEKFELFLFVPLVFLFLKGVLESSPMQGSPGQVLFGLKVTTQKGRRLNVLHSLWRQLMYGVTMVGFKVTVWINFFLNGRLLHDRMSGTIVIKR